MEALETIEWIIYIFVIIKTTQYVLGIAAGFLFIIGFVPYGIAIVKRTTKPSKVSWIIWLSIDLVTFGGMIAKGTLNGQMIGIVGGGGIILLLALLYGESGWTKLDKFCLAGAAIGMALLLFNNPLLAIISSATVGFIGSFPTFISAWQDPGREDKLAWTIYWLSCVCAVCAIPHLTIADALQPLDFFLIESIMMIILYSRQPKNTTGLAQEKKQ